MWGGCPSQVQYTGERMRVLLLSHGYPPREAAGTEQHVATVAAGLRARGHDVLVCAATRAPGRPQYALQREGAGLVRLVNNLPGRPLAQAEADPAIDAAIGRVVADFRPEVVHVHHLQFLSTGLRFPVPTAWTLHDGWGWCAAGGLELEHPAGRPCQGPDPARCPACAAAWTPVPGAVVRGLSRLAGHLAPLVRPERLHGWWRRLPASWRARLPQNTPAPVGPASGLGRRHRAFQAFAAACARRFAPSAWLAARASAMGLGPVEVLPNGVPPALRPRVGGGPFLFLGTIAPHKGPDLVRAAVDLAFGGSGPGLRVHGPVGDPALAARVEAGPALGRAAVAEALSEARALVLGSRWAENAPLVVLEARAAGCPVVAPRSGGLPELVAEGVDGRLYTPGDTADLARALRAVVDGPPLQPRPPPSDHALIDALESIYADMRGRAAR